MGGRNNRPAKVEPEAVEPEAVEAEAEAVEDVANDEDVTKLLVEDMVEIKPMDCDDCEERKMNIPKVWLDNFINNGWEKV